MFRKLLLTLGALLLAVNLAFAAGVDVNSADRAALDGIKGIGGKTADAIIAERDKHGKFKDWDDLVKRVKGVGPGNAAKFSAGGLTVNGQAMANAPAAAKESAKKEKTAAAPAPAAAAEAKPADAKSVKAEAKKQ